MLVIGNDIVDLTDPCNQGKFRDRRFRGRVFTAAEERRIDASPRPDETLWAFWAAKEAAFKAAVKMRPGLGFIPRAYRVVEYEDEFPAEARPGPPAAAAITGGSGGMGTGKDHKPASARILYVGETAPDSLRKTGLISTPAGAMPLEFMASEAWVHCLALGGWGVRGGHGGGRGIKEGREGQGSGRGGQEGQRSQGLRGEGGSLEGRRDGGGGDVAASGGAIQVGVERRGMPFEPAAALRRVTVHCLADILKASPYCLEIRRARASCGCAGPPRVFLEGRPAEVDISLTHDGVFIAYAVSV